MSATWQAGDTAPPIRFTISEGGVALDLTDITVTFRFGPKGGPTAWERACAVDAEDQGTCYYAWQVGDLAMSGEYEGQLVLEYPPAEGEEEGATRLSAPFEIVVARSLPAPSPPEP